MSSVLVLSLSQRDCPANQESVVEWPAEVIVLAVCVYMCVCTGAFASTVGADIFAKKILKGMVS